jgi:hypothetical protein
LGQGGRARSGARGHVGRQDVVGVAIAQHPVAVFFAEVGAGGFEDPQAEQPKHGYQREVAEVTACQGAWESQAQGEGGPGDRYSGDREYAKCYRFKPVRRAWIPKKNGSAP